MPGIVGSGYPVLCLPLHLLKDEMPVKISAGNNELFALLSTSFYTSEIALTLKVNQQGHPSLPPLPPTQPNPTHQSLTSLAFIAITCTKRVLMQVYAVLMQL